MNNINFFCLFFVNFCLIRPWPLSLCCDCGTECPFGVSVHESRQHFSHSGHSFGFVGQNVLSCFKKACGGATLNKKPTNWWCRQKAAPLKFDIKPSETVFLLFCQISRNADRKKVADDVISSVAIY